MHKTNRLLYASFAAALVLTAMAACKKHSAQPSVDCINQTATPANQIQLSIGQLDSVKTLFAANNLDPTPYHFISFTASVFTDTSNPVQSQVNAIPLVNGLEVFGAFDSFVFTSGKLDSASLSVTKPSSSDASGNQSLENLRTAFLSKASESFIYSSLGTSAGDPDKVKDSCLSATLGYVDVSTMPGSTVPYGTRLTKVWFVSPASTDFPGVYVEDSTGTAWGAVYIYP